MTTSSIQKTPVTGWAAVLDVLHSDVMVPMGPHDVGFEPSAQGSASSPTIRAGTRVKAERKTR
jgi:hypothetical protein